MSDTGPSAPAASGTSPDAPAEPGAELRPVRPGDAPAIARLARRAFGPTEAVFVRSRGEGFVVEAPDGLAAAVLLRVIPLSRGRKAGFVSWVMTDPDHRGRGLASALTARGVARLDEMGCERILTEIEGHNTGSQGVFRGLGFHPVGLRTQIAAFGLAGTVSVHLRTNVIFDPGHDLWLLDAAPEPAAEGPQRLACWGLNAAFALMALGLGGGLLLSGAPSWPSVMQAAFMILAVAVTLGLREAVMRGVARAHGMPVRFRGWVGGWGITAAIALLFGSLFPLPGSVYPAAPDWRYRAALPVLGRAALAGTAAVAALVALALWTVAALPDTLAGAFAASLLVIGTPLLVFDAVMAFPPFHAFNARRIHDLHRGLWAGMAALALLLVLW